MAGMEFNITCAAWDEDLVPQRSDHDPAKASHQKGGDVKIANPLERGDPYDPNTGTNDQFYVLAQRLGYPVVERSIFNPKGLTPTELAAQEQQNETPKL